MRVCTNKVGYLRTDCAFSQLESKNLKAGHHRLTAGTMLVRHYMLAGNGLNMSFESNINNNLIKSQNISKSVNPDFVALKQQKRGPDYASA